MRRQTVLGFLVAAAFSLAAHRAGALTVTGAAAATAVGGTVVAGAGVSGGAALVTFFVSSTILGRLPARGQIEQRRGQRRDAVQVLANGGLAAVLAGASRSVSATFRPLLLAAFSGAVAAAAADTWATEIGSRFGVSPRLISSLQPVSPGTSGAVTVAGFLASLAGASTIAAVCSAGILRGTEARRAVTLAVATGGVTGACVDSVLGALVQEMRHCPSCRRQTELLIHGCGAPTVRLRGASWCNNDVVNVIAIAAGAATSVAGYAATRHRAAMSVALRLTSEGGLGVEYLPPRAGSSRRGE